MYPIAVECVACDAVISILLAPAAFDKLHSASCQPDGVQR